MNIFGTLWEASEMVSLHRRSIALHDHSMMTQFAQRYLSTSQSFVWHKRLRCR